MAYDYAVMHLGAVIGTACARMDWTHQLTPLSNEIKQVQTSVDHIHILNADCSAVCNRIIPTIYPQDDCLLQFRKADLTSAA